MTAGRAASAHVLDLLYVAISTDFSVSNLMATGTRAQPSPFPARRAIYLRHFYEIVCA